ncbi:MAG: 3'-5' exonuclease [Cytophagales bacterium]|nr:3'-5' exonuclease [Cytophagales bacterium]
MLSRFFAKKVTYPEWMANYEAQVFKPEMKQSIWSPGYVVLDCETTGIAKKDKIVSIGAVIVQNKSIALGNVLDIHLPITENSAAAAIHGELSDQSRERDIKQALPEILNFLSNHIIVGHHLPFDLGKLNKLYQLHYPGFKLKNPVLDTMTMMKRIDPVRYERNVAGSDSMQLDVLCKEFGILVENRHTALGDAYLTAQLFQKLLVKLKARGIDTMGNLLKTPGGF